MMKSNLAIVIPAYKIDFFRATLDSLATQTCKDFTVYIGDDCSSADFKSLVDEYSSQLDVVYNRFDTNLGGKDLVGQWTRCIRMTKGEPWIWLFSDDDMMGTDCVEKFFEAIKEEPEYDLYHFNVEAIDENGDVFIKCREFPDVLTSLDFYKMKERDDIDSFVVEYIFRRDVYEKEGGFQKFDLAWGSDIATWVKLGNRRGIKTVKQAKVYWRKSHVNITPNRHPEMVARKFMINIDYLQWANKFFGVKVIGDYNKYVFFRLFCFYSLILTREQLEGVANKAVVSMIIKPEYKSRIMLLLPLIRIGKWGKSKIRRKEKI